MRMPDIYVSILCLSIVEKLSSIHVYFKNPEANSPVKGAEVERLVFKVDIVYTATSQAIT